MKTTYEIDYRNYEWLGCGFGAQLACFEPRPVEHGDVRCIGGMLFTPCTIQRKFRGLYVSWGLIGLEFLSHAETQAKFAQLKKYLGRE